MTQPVVQYCLFLFLNSFIRSSLHILISVNYDIDMKILVNFFHVHLYFSNFVVCMKHKYIRILILKQSLHSTISISISNFAILNWTFL